jgi:PAS domain S-box-containing protein
MLSRKYLDAAISNAAAGAADLVVEDRREAALLKTGALQNAIFNSANFSSIATDAKGVIQIFNVGAERMLGYAADEVVNKITPADISDPQEVIARAEALSIELGTPITPGFEALVFKASRGIEDIYELTYFRKDGSRFPAVVSITALRDAPGGIISYLLIGTDNTARKQAEEALRENYALLRTIHLHSIVSVTDQAGRIVDANEGFCKISGYSRDELLGQTHLIVNSGVQTCEFWTDMWQSITAGRPWRGEICNRTKEGALYWVDSIIAAFMSEDGHTKRYISVRTDITARKQAEEALLKAGALQNAIFNSANFSSIATDAKGVIQIFNVGAERMLGYEADEVVNKITPADISDPLEVIARAEALSVELGTPITPGFEALVFKASRGIEDIYELTYIRKDGSRFPAVVSVTALRDAPGGIIGYLLIGTDNTARKHVEAEQQQLDQRLRDQQFYTRSLIESNIDALMTTDPAGVITDVNKQMEALTGSTRDELIGAPFKNCFTDPERAQAGIKQVLSHSKVTDYELTARARDGKETVVSYNATTFHDRDRKLQGVFAAARDVTERKRLEHRQRQTNVELERAKAVAEKANLAKSDFLSSMSHEIRTPMNAILGMADLLWESELSGEQREYVGAFRRAGTNLLTLINAILDLSRIESGKFELHPVDFHLDDVIATTEMLRGRAETKGLRFALRISPDVPRELNGDADRLRQVLINLLGNAIKFTNTGVVGLDVELETLPDDATQALRFKISDTGSGIPAQKLARIFEAFTQADTSISDRYGGTGLGLTISRSLVELMGGQLEVSSEEGKGSVFTFVIRFAGAINPTPRLASPAIPSTPSDDYARRSLQKARTGRILLVEDSKDNQLLITAYLKDSAYQIEIAEDGQAAVDKFTTGGFDLVLMDVNMPVMNGYAATRKIREWEMEHTRRVPILALTAYAMDGEAATGRDAGCDAHLTKPIQKATLLKAIEEYLKAPETIRVVAPEGIGELIPGYLRNRRADLPSLRAALEKNDFSSIQVVGHQMKGSGTGYGFPALSEIGRGLEIAAKEETAEGVRAQISALTDYLDRVEIVPRTNEISVIT